MMIMTTYLLTDLVSILPDQQISDRKAVRGCSRRHIVRRRAPVVPTNRHASSIRTKTRTHVILRIRTRTRQMFYYRR